MDVLVRGDSLKPVGTVKTKGLCSRQLLFGSPTDGMERRGINTYHLLPVVLQASSARHGAPPEIRIARMTTTVDCLRRRRRDNHVACNEGTTGVKKEWLLISGYRVDFVNIYSPNGIKSLEGGSPEIGVPVIVTDGAIRIFSFVRGSMIAHRRKGATGPGPIWDLLTCSLLFIAQQSIPAIYRWLGSEGENHGQPGR